MQWQCTHSWRCLNSATRRPMDIMSIMGPKSRLILLVTLSINRSVQVTHVAFMSTSVSTSNMLICPITTGARSLQCTECAYVRNVAWFSESALLLLWIMGTAHANESMSLFYINYSLCSLYSNKKTDSMFCRNVNFCSSPPICRLLLQKQLDIKSKQKTFVLFPARNFFNV